MTARYVRHPEIRITALEGEGMVLHLGERRYFSVNETGLVLLEALQRPCTMGELAAAIRDEYDVSEAEATATTTAFLEQCLDARVVSRTEA
ncbi:MAG: PqqD family protein [Gemmatimonadales bacterium]